MSFSIVIPSRYSSSRLPGKPLQMIGSKTLIQRVYECAKQSDADEIVIATDDERIEAESHRFSAKVCMTRDDHETGTDRLAEVIEILQYPDDHIIVNLQGDEPLMPASVINQVARNLSDNPEASSATVCSEITEAHELFDANIVKVVSDDQGFALYFSRAPIPWVRDQWNAVSFSSQDSLPKDVTHYRHIGLYAYRVGFLKKFVRWPVCSLERSESLEQLRSLSNGEKIHVETASEAPGPGVDTPNDLEKVRQLFRD